MHKAVRYMVKHVNQHNFRLCEKALTVCIRGTTSELKLSAETIHVETDCEFIAYGVYKVFKKLKLSVLAKICDACQIT